MKEPHGTGDPSNELLILGGEISAIIGIKTPVIAHHLNVHTNMCVIYMGVEGATDSPSTQSQRLNHYLSKGQHLWCNMIWDLEAVVCSHTVH